MREVQVSRKNPATAERWLRRAAEQGHQRAITYIDAALQNDAKAQNQLGSLYDTGEGVDEDDTEAMLWYREAAQQGHIGAQGKLGWMYENGLGIAPNSAEAIRWYQMAAAPENAGIQGYESAQKALRLIKSKIRAEKQREEIKRATMQPGA